jgi:hypothetical protein
MMNMIVLFGLEMKNAMVRMTLCYALSVVLSAVSFARPGTCTCRRTFALRNAYNTTR